MDAVETRILDNGLRVLLVPVQGVPSVSVMCLVGMGSRYESVTSCGAAHFYEHLVHDGSERFPSSKLFSEVLESKGADANAMTGEEFTAYYMKLEARYVDLALEMLGQMMLHPLLLEAEVEREKGVIVEEINMREDMPHVKVSDRVSELLFEGNEIGLPTAGTKETVRSFSRKTFLDLKRNVYTADNSIIVVSGQLSNSEAVFESVATHFGKMPTGKNLRETVSPEAKTGGSFEVISRATDQVHLALAFRGFSRTDSRKYAQNLIAVLLGGGFSSRLFQKVRQELGLAYSIHTDVDLFTDSGLWMVSAGLDKSRLNSAVAVIWDELLKVVAENNVTPDELQKCKDYLRGQTALRLEDPLQLGLYYGMQWLLDGRITALSEVFNRLDATSLDEVRKYAEEVFQPENLACVVVGGDTKVEELSSHFS